MITANIQIILIITGLATATTLAQFIAPTQVIRSTYGEVLTSTVSIAIARNWGLGVFCVGALLVYSAFHLELRAAAMTVAIVGKVGFIAGILGTSLRKQPMALFLVVVDSISVLLYSLYFSGV